MVVVENRRGKPASSPRNFKAFRHPRVLSLRVDHERENHAMYAIGSEISGGSHGKRRKIP